MNREDPFERRLRSQPLRPVPPNWREGILQSARTAARSQQAQSVAQVGGWARLRALLEAWLWPHPRVWAGLAGVWCVILGLSLASRESSLSELANLPPPKAPPMRELLRYQAQLLVELAGPAEKPVAERPKSAAPKPRSESGRPTMNT